MGKPPPEKPKKGQTVSNPVKKGGLANDHDPFKKGGGNIIRNSEPPPPPPSKKK